MSSIWISIIPSVLLFVSEVLPFLPNKYNGIAHFLYEIAREIAVKSGINVAPEDANKSVPLGDSVKSNPK
jgi:hypothetical protein